MATKRERQQRALGMINEALTAEDAAPTTDATGDEVVPPTTSEEEVQPEPQPEPDHVDLEPEPEPEPRPQAIPKERLDEVIAQRNDAREQIESLTQQVRELQAGQNREDVVAKTIQQLQDRGVDVEGADSIAQIAAAVFENVAGDKLKRLEELERSNGVVYGALDESTRKRAEVTKGIRDQFPTMSAEEVALLAKARQPDLFGESARDGFDPKIHGSLKPRGSSQKRQPKKPPEPEDKLAKMGQLRGRAKRLAMRSHFQEVIQNMTPPT